MLTLQPNIIGFFSERDKEGDVSKRIEVVDAWVLFGSLNSLWSRAQFPERNQDFRGQEQLRSA